MAYVAPNLRIAGSKAWQTVTINHAAVGETTSHILLQWKIPRTGAVATNVDSADDIGITGIADTTRIPRYVVFYPDIILIYADGAASISADQQYRLHFGKALNEVNSSAAFTNSGISNFWGMDASSGNNILDYAGNASAVIQGGDMTLGGASLFGGGLSAANSGYANISTNLNSQLSNKNTLDISMVIKPNNFSASHTFFNIQASSSLRIWAYTNTAVLGFSLCNGGTQTTYVALANAGITAGNWYHIVFRFNGSGATDAEKLKYFVNGAQKTVVFYESPPTTTPNLGTSVGTFGSSTSPFNGVVDQFEINNTKYNSPVTKYNMLFAPSTFYTMGAVETGAAKQRSKWDVFRAGFKAPYIGAWK